MAYDLNTVNGYGTGALGDVINPTGQICSYANVASVTEVAVATNALTINAPSLGIYEKFEVGTEILLHVSGCLSGATAEYLGRYIVCKITAVQTSTLSSAGKILIIDKQVTDVLPIDQFAAHILQVVTIPQFKKLTVTGTVAPIAYNATNKYGGILPIKCLIELVLSGSGKINLIDMGIPVANKILRYWTLQEFATPNSTAVTMTTSGNGLLDTDKYSAWENHMTVRQLLLNSGDGIFACWAQKITNTDATTNTRIGSAAGGVQFCRGANDSKGYNETKPANTTNIGGSTIMLVADDLDGFTPRMIAKYRDSTKALGQGLGRCYIALKNQVLYTDEGLYAFDIISDQQRVMRELNIKNYGSGRHGDVTNPTQALNNYAAITKIDNGGKTITYSNLTSGGLAGFDDGALVMLHVSKHLDSKDMGLLGRFTLARIVHHYTADCVLILDSSINKILPADQLTKYSVQVISVFEPANFTINTNYDKTTAWDDTKKVGGLCAIACKNICNIKDGMINVENKATSGTYYGQEGLKIIGNTSMKERLPLGRGEGSIFLLTNNLISDEDSRLGSLHDGSLFGGYGDHYDAKVGGGFSARQTRRDMPGDSIYSGYLDYSNSGSHVFLICNIWDKFYLKNISTGGLAGYPTKASPGGAGYGGGGSQSGSISDLGHPGAVVAGGYGAYRGQNSGFCFMYCKEIREIDNTGVVK